jgi:NAD(P)H-flavin reductase
MSEWFSAAMAESVSVGDSLVRLALQVPVEVSSSFSTPGQYHRVRVEGADNLFAIASRPGSPRFEYLVRRNAGVAAQLATLPVGTSVAVSRAQGPGFPISLGHGRRVLMVATGTGFAPVRSVLEHVAAHRERFGAVQALLGVRSELERPGPDELERWAAAGLQLAATVSHPSAEWRGLVGHVQAHLAGLEVGDAVAFLCGQREMVADVTAALMRRGLPAERVGLNLPR